MHLSRKAAKLCLTVSCMLRDFQKPPDAFASPLVSVIDKVFIVVIMDGYEKIPFYRSIYMQYAVRLQKC